MFYLFVPMCSEFVDLLQLFMVVYELYCLFVSFSDVCVTFHEFV